MTTFLKGLIWVLPLTLLVGCKGGNSTSATSDSDTAQAALIQADIDYCLQKVERALEAQRDSSGHIDYTQQLRNIPSDEQHWTTRPSVQEEWCSGFWPGILWMAAKADSARAPQFSEAAKQYAASLAFLAHQPVYDHDLGFIMIGSHLKGWELAPTDDYKQLLLAAADTLATLYNPQVGTLLSWPRNVEMFGGHNTIMDNMINLELLFWAAKNGGDQRLHDIAVKHAETTMQHHFRPDFTSYHVAVYDPINGDFLRGCTHQGLADSTMWARGQAWAIYGYTMVYRETQDERFLTQAQRATDVYLDRLPEDMIPYWDFSATDYRDVSAACVVASALLDLYTYVKDESTAQRYREAAYTMLASLRSDTYRSNGTNDAMLLHSVGNYPADSEIDASIIYADYYYLEALLKYR